MRAISLWQPWASLWLSPAKVHETRHWPIMKNWVTEVPFQLLVHAAKKKISDDLDLDLQGCLRFQFGMNWRENMPMGMIIGLVTVESCLRMDQTRPISCDDRVCGDWSPGRFAWRRGEYRVFKTPIPYRGRQGLFTIPDELLREAWEPIS